MISQVRYVVIFTVVGGLVGCATGPEPTGEPEVTLEECVSERGQQFLTFCSSRDAAELAERQHAIARSADADGETADDMVPLPVDGAPVRGERDAPMTIHLFSDLTCRDCRTVYQRLAAEVDHHPGEMRLVFRHTAADDAARAAIAAGEQGKFFEFVDGLYDADAVAEPDRWDDIAESIGLDIDDWQRDRRSPIIDAVLERDQIKAEDVGFVEAPTFFVNGVRKVGGVAIQEFDEVAAAERQDVEAMTEAGLSGADISWRRILQNYEPVDWDEVEEARRDLQQELSVEYVPVDDAPQRGAEADEILVTVVFFADFTCRYCAEKAAVLDELVDHFGPTGMRLVIRHFPLASGQGADDAAAASIVAQQGGVFWDFHDAMFFDGVAPEIGPMQQVLEQLGWSGDDLVELVDNPGVRDGVERDRRLGDELGVEGTPTVFVNGIKIEGVWPAAEFAPLIEDQIALAASVADLPGYDGEQLYRATVEANKD